MKALIRRVHRLEERLAPARETEFVRCLREKIEQRWLTRKRPIKQRLPARPGSSLIAVSCRLIKSGHHPFLYRDIGKFDSPAASYEQGMMILGGSSRSC